MQFVNQKHKKVIGNATCFTTRERRSIRLSADTGWIRISCMPFLLNRPSKHAKGAKQADEHSRCPPEPTSNPFAQKGSMKAGRNSLSRLSRLSLFQQRRCGIWRCRKESRQSDSNRRPADYKSAALPTELYRHLLWDQAAFTAFDLPTSRPDSAAEP